MNTPSYNTFYQGPSQQQLMAQALMNQNMQNAATQNPTTAPVSPMTGLNQLKQLPPGIFGLGQPTQQPQLQTPQQQALAQIPGAPSSMPSLGSGISWQPGSS